MSTFSGLNTAYTGLVAARQGFEVVGQNIANANTVGYTRQRVTTSAIGALAQVGPLAGAHQVGGGVTVDGIARLGNEYLDARVRNSAGIAGYAAVRANVMNGIETSLNEPGENGLSAQLQEFWASWQDLSNRAGEPAAGGIVLEQAGVLVSQIARGYSDTERQWAQLRDEVGGMVNELNSAATQVAELNKTIRSTLAAGGSVNELLDRRSALTTTMAALTGATVVDHADGTVDVLVAGNAMVSGETVRPVAAVGASRLADAASPVQLEWAHRPGSSVALTGGELAGALSMLAPADTTKTGGSLAEAAASFNELATALADQVNAVHQTGATVSGKTGQDFFAFTAGRPAALGLTVVPTDVSEIAAGTPGAGGHSGTVADAISQLGSAAGSPDKIWSGFVTRVGVAARTEFQQASLAELAAVAASTAQLSNSSVDLDEENVSLISYQTAYQGAARVMTAIDEMLDTLINRTGIVGR